MVPIIAIALIVVSDTHKCEALPAYTAAPSETGAGDTSMTVNIERVARVLEAAKGALHRLSGIYRADLASAFGPLGESLTWLCAADELFSRELASYGTLRDNDDAGRTLPGLRFARNHAVHGTDVASVAGRVEGSDFAREIALRPRRQVSPHLGRCFRPTGVAQTTSWSTTYIQRTARRTSAPNFTRGGVDLPVGCPRLTLLRLLHRSPRSIGPQPVRSAGDPVRPRWCGRGRRR
jgi:hypothetical protein